MGGGAEEAIAVLRKDPAGWGVLTAVVPGAYFMNPAIREASVVGVPDAHWGEAAVAAVVLRDGASLDADAVVAHVRAHLAAYKRPRHVVFLAALPRTAASQQVHKPLLREQVLALLASTG